MKKIISKTLIFTTLLGVVFFPSWQVYQKQKKVHTDRRTNNLEIVSTSLIVHKDAFVTLNISNFNDLEISGPIFWETDLGELKVLESQMAEFHPHGETGQAKITVSAFGEGKNQSDYFGEITIDIPKKIVIFKIDDLNFDEEFRIEECFIRLHQVVEEFDIKVSVGIVGKSLERGIRGNENSMKIKEWHEKGNFELWNHGYTHTCEGEDYNFMPSKLKAPDMLFRKDNVWEFKNTSFEYQKEHLELTQRLALEKLGIVLKTFGASCNKVDENTVKALEEIPELKVWFFNQSFQSSKFVLNNRLNFEKEVGRPDFQYFLEQYDEDLDYLVLQLHVREWDEQGWNEFIKLIHLFKDKDVRSVIPSAMPLIKGHAPYYPIK